MRLNSTISAAASTSIIDSQTASSPIVESSLEEPAEPLIQQMVDSNLDALQVSDSVFQQPAVIEAVTKLGDLASLGMSTGTPAGLVRSFMELVHVYGGLPWAGTIIAATILFRAGMFPIMIKVQRSMAKIQNLKPITDPIAERAKQLRLEGKMAQSQEESMKMFKVFKENGVSPLSPLLGLVQVYRLKVDCF